MELDSQIDDAIRAFLDASTETSVHQTLVNVTAEMVPVDLCTVATVEEGTLEVQVRSDDRPVDPDCRLSLNGTVLEPSIATGSAEFIDDIGFTRSAATHANTHGQGDVRALFVVPIANGGVLLGTASTPGVFDEADRTLVERLVSYADAALARLTREEEELVHHDRFEKFGTVITHDLRGPLGVAHGYTEYCQDTGDLDHLDTVLEALDRADQIITDLATLIQQGQAIGTSEDVSLASIVTDCWTMIETAEATLAIDGDLEFSGDRSQLRHLFENLFRNAVVHGDEAVQITVGAMADGFYVENTGLGIPPAHRDTLFDPGFTTAATGTGYGLAIVKQIVDAHGWTITVTDGHDGGARFEITGVQ
ncbi:sensor histidine kinase [Natronosalvus rutilus]|uniref:histidine kinase n=1 Tax=Natronosalvus rutilus TaxID=2953753 RepID=A0A9E7NCH6_9EURY|nr:GAF domain-containing sensor histidine kinase [Natronosalvus rutilus]UTF54831.1 GAF domain-containing sensor histidine kinase [Natronosalvus rutilus]